MNVWARYFAEHGFTPELATFYGVDDEAPSTVHYRCFDRDGRFRRSRDLTSSRKRTRQPKGRRLRVCYLSPPPDRADELLICEGEPDALAALQAKHTPPERAVASRVLKLRIAFVPGTATPAARIVEEIERIGARRVYLAFDEDVPGHKAAERVFAAALRLRTVIGRVSLPEPHNDLAETLAASSGNRADVLMALLDRGVV